MARLTLTPVHFINGTHEACTGKMAASAHWIDCPCLAGPKLPHGIHIARERRCCQVLDALWADAEPLEFRVI